MAVQVRQDNTNTPLILRGSAVSMIGKLEQDAGRTTDMVKGTVLARIGSSGLWVPLTDLAATDGTQMPGGILLATIPAADIVADNVEGVPILIGDAIVDLNGITLENSLDLDSPITVPTSFNQSVRTVLRWLGLYVENTVDITGFEN